MKTLIMLLAFIVLAGVLWAATPAGDDPAISGCCKQKVGNNWRRIEGSFESCQQLNNADGDNVFEPKGTYWWDAGC